MTGSVHRAFQFWLRLVLLVLAAVPSFINLKLTLVACFCDASGRFLHCSFSFADATFNIPCLFFLPPEPGEGLVPCLECRELWGP